MSAKAEMEAIAEELKVALLYSDRNTDSVKNISTLTGFTKRTVYGYLDGEIKITLNFIHAAVIATDGDPDIKKFLEPDGWRLIPIDIPAPGRENLPEECLDDLAALAEFHEALINPASREKDIEDIYRKVREELEQDLVLWRQKRHKTDRREGMRMSSS
jgi:hypothetical protein